MEDKSLQTYLQDRGLHFWVRSTPSETIVVIHCGCDYDPQELLMEAFYSSVPCCMDDNCECDDVYMWPCSHVDGTTLPKLDGKGDIYPPAPAWDGVSDPF